MTLPSKLCRDDVNVRSMPRGLGTQTECVDRYPLAIGLDVCNQGVLSIPAHSAVRVPLRR